MLTVNLGIKWRLEFRLLLRFAFTGFYTANAEEIFLATLQLVVVNVCLLGVDAQHAIYYCLNAILNSTAI